MNLDITPQDEVFRAEVRAYFTEVFPRWLLDKVASGQSLSRADLMASERALEAKGWLAPGWPVEHGGTGWSVTQRFIFEEEMQRAGAPRVVPMGLLYLAPVIYTFGTDAQKARWLPDILSGRTFWAQGYSEPESGSDLASLRTSAEGRGDHYVVNGIKVWTSQAHFADWGSKPNSRGVPQRRTSTLPVSSTPTGTLSCGRLGRPISRLCKSACRLSRRSAPAFRASAMPLTSAIRAPVSLPCDLN